MIYLYVAGSLVLIIGGLFAWAKIQGARADKFKVEAQAANETAKSAQAEIIQTNKTADAVETVKESEAVTQKAAQVNIDAGKRDDFNVDSF